MYSIVQFDGQKINEVPSCWVERKGKEDYCAWPNQENKVLEQIKSQKVPSSSWKRYKVKVMRRNIDANNSTTGSETVLTRKHNESHNATEIEDQLDIDGNNKNKANGENGNKASTSGRDESTGGNNPRHGTSSISNSQNKTPTLKEVYDLLRLTYEVAVGNRSKLKTILSTPTNTVASELPTVSQFILPVPLSSKEEVENLDVKISNDPDFYQCLKAELKMGRSTDAKEYYRNMLRRVMTSEAAGDFVYKGQLREGMNKGIFFALKLKTLMWDILVEAFGKGNLSEEGLHRTAGVFFRNAGTKKNGPKAKQSKANDDPVHIERTQTPPDSDSEMAIIPDSGSETFES